MKRTPLVVLVATAATAFAFRPSLAGTPLFWAGLAVPYLALAALALHKLWQDGTLLAALSPRGGDVAVGVATGAVLVLSSFAGRALLAPAGTPRLAWLYLIYNQVGSPDHVQRSLVLTLLVLLIAVAEEVVWRSLVLSELAERFGTRRAWPLTALLYALSIVPTLYTLRDSVAGPNPLLVTAALGCGIVWSFLATVTRRVPPVAIAHMTFTYFSLVQFRWPSL